MFQTRPNYGRPTMIDRMRAISKPTYGRGKSRYMAPSLTQIIPVLKQLAPLSTPQKLMQEPIDIKKGPRQERLAPPPKSTKKGAGAKKTKSAAAPKSGIKKIAPISKRNKAVLDNMIVGKGMNYF